MVTEPVSRMSRDDEPTKIWCAPPVVGPAVVVQVWKLRASRVSDTCWVWPGLRCTRWKPRRFFGGSPAAAGWPT